MNPTRRRVLGIAAVVVVVSAAVFAVRLASRPAAVATDVGYFTTDDGATYYKAAFPAPPYVKDGRPATRVMVFTGDGGRTCFVGYLIRPIAGTDNSRVPLSEVRRPGPGQTWVAQPLPRTPPGDPRAVAYSAITAVRTADGRRVAARIDP